MLSDNLKVLLASTQAFAIKTQNFHWNVEGSNFPQYHEFFNTLYEDVNATIDPIAPRISKHQKYLLINTFENVFKVFINPFL